GRRDEPAPTANERRAREADQGELPQLDVLDRQHAKERSEVAPQQREPEHERARHRSTDRCEPRLKYVQRRAERDRDRKQVDDVAVQRERAESSGGVSVYRIQNEQEEGTVLARLVDRRGAECHLTIQRLQFLDDLTNVRFSKRKQHSRNSDVD